MKIFKEFKEFAVKGNVIDLAVGVVIGGAFGKIVSSLVADIIMPPFGLLFSNINFADFRWILTRKPDGAPLSAVNYGIFFQNVIEFLIVAASIFLVIKSINLFRRKKEESKLPHPSKQEQLLEEIRDILKTRGVK